MSNYVVLPTGIRYITPRLNKRGNHRHNVKVSTHMFSMAKDNWFSSLSPLQSSDRLVNCVKMVSSHHILGSGESIYVGHHTIQV